MSRLAGVMLTGMLVVSFPFALASQERNDLRSGAPIRIYSAQLQWAPQPTLARYRGVQGDSLVYTTNAEQHRHRQAISLQAISRLEVGRSTRGYRLLGLGVGALAGGVLGYAIGSTSETKSCWGGSCSSNPSDPLAEGALTSLGVILGGLTGYLAGGSVTRWQEVPLR